MARLEKFSKDIIMNKMVEYIRENGIQSFTVRDVAKYIGCSTQPLFRLYTNTEELKKDLKRYLHDDYDRFIDKYINKEDYLFTISYAYALYAKDVPNIFRTLFITDIAGTRTIEEVLNSSWNRQTIECMSNQYSISISDSEKVYRDVRFFTHGIATQLCIRSISVSEDELKYLIRHMIDLCVSEIKQG